MTTLHEFFDLLRSVGIEPSELANALVTKATAKGAKKLAGASNAIFSNFIRRLRDQRGYARLEKALKESHDHSKREAAIRTALERWISERQHDASETARLLFRIVYLRALRAHCNDLPVVANLAFRSQKLQDVWVHQDFRFKTTPNSQPTNREGAQSSIPSLEQVLATGTTRIVLEGPAGSGKSTQLRKFILDRITTLLNLDDFNRFLNEPLPIYVSAADLVSAQCDRATTLEVAVRSSIGMRFPFPIPSGFFDRRQAGSATSLLLVVDGINEIDPVKRNYIINIFGPTNSDSASDMIVIFASGPLDDSIVKLWDGFSQIEILGLEQNQVNSLVAKLLGAKASRTFIDSTSRLPNNPMLLTLATLLKETHAISLNAVLYQEFILALLKKRSDIGLIPNRPAALVLLLSALANTDEPPNIERVLQLACELGLSSQNTLGLARRETCADLLIATGIVARRSGRLDFIHHSFRSYFRAEHFANLYSPLESRVWDQISPLREGWDTITFVCEIWIRGGHSVSRALGELLAFGTRGLRTISILASQSPEIPLSVIESTVAKWMFREENDFWEPGLIDGPVQQLALIASHYEIGRNALRKITKDDWTFQEDAAYAAEALAHIGLVDEAKDALVRQCNDRNIYSPNRVLAVEILLDIGLKAAARDRLDFLTTEWRTTPPDTENAFIWLGKLQYKVGQKRRGLLLLKHLSQELTEEIDLKILSETYAELGFPKQAASIARQIFGKMKWPADPTGWDNYMASDLANLLDRVGVRKEATLIRKRFVRTEDVDVKELANLMLDSRRDAGQRLEVVPLS